MTTPMGGDFGARAGPATSPAPAPRRNDTSMRQAAVIAASALLVMSVLSPVGYFYIFPRLIDRASIAQTAHNIIAHQGLFTAGILCYLVTFLCDVLAAWALVVFLRPVNASLSLLAGWFRLTYAAMALVALLKLVTVLRLLRSPDFLATFGPDALHAHIQLLLSAFRYDWGFSMLVFAVHLGLLGYLVFRSGYVPRVLGVLLVINGAAYAVDSLRPYLFPSVTVPYLVVAFFGELIFMLWLFFRGSTLRDPVAPPPE
jgi:uncharacterized protein DUF4386